MNEIETTNLPNDDHIQHSDEGFTFDWFKLIIGAAICYFWLYSSWTFLIALAVVVIIHELGHVTAGKLFGCIIEEMQVFLLSFVSYKPKQVAGGSSWRNIKWSLGTLPLGGFTVFANRQNHDMDEAEVTVLDKDETTASPYIDDKPAWQQLLINAGGVLFNFATFLILYFSLSFLPSGWHNICVAIMILSLALAVLNILPVYPLDGGAIIFSCYEMITGRKPSPQFVKICGIIGFIIIIVFFWIFPNWIDSFLERVFELFF